MRNRILLLLLWRRTITVSEAWWLTSRYRHLFLGKEGFSTRRREDLRIGVHSSTRKPPPMIVHRRLCATQDDSSARIYSRPSLYDLAFGYRDFDQEVATLLELHKRATGRDAESVVELAAGPARHCWAVPLTTVYAVDKNPEMKDYSESLQQQQLQSFEYLVQDMRNVELPTLVDTAWILLGSFQHMVTLSDAKQCFKSVRNNLNVNGTLILELPHPKELFSMVECTSNMWTVPLELDTETASGSLQVIWGDADDPLDALTHIRNSTIGFHLETEDHQEQWTEIVPMRFYTLPELYLLAELSGFRVVQVVGALDHEIMVPIDDEDLAYRLVCVLQKI